MWRSSATFKVESMRWQPSRAAVRLSQARRAPGSAPGALERGERRGFAVTSCSGTMPEGLMHAAEDDASPQCRGAP